MSVPDAAVCSTLFDAPWIGMQMQPDPEDTSWWRVDATTLDAWTAAWGDEHRGVFVPALLERRDLALVAGGPLRVWLTTG